VLDCFVVVDNKVLAVIDGVVFVGDDLVIVVFVGGDQVIVYIDVVVAVVDIDC